MKKIIKIITAVAVALGLTSLIALPTYATDPTYTPNICDQPNVSDEVKAASGCSGTSSAELTASIRSILNAIIGILGIVSVIVIVIGGVNYMTSQGDPGKTKKAKDTILYAAIGLIICVLSFAIVNFVASVANRSQASSYTTSSACTDAGYTWDSSSRTCK